MVLSNYLRNPCIIANYYYDDILGGYILIGFHNDTGEPTIDSIPTNVRRLFQLGVLCGAQSIERRE